MRIVLKHSTPRRNTANRQRNSGMRRFTPVATSDSPSMVAGESSKGTVMPVDFDSQHGVSSRFDRALRIFRVASRLFAFHPSGTDAAMIRAIAHVAPQVADGSRKG